MHHGKGSLRLVRVQPGKRIADMDEEIVAKPDLLEQRDGHDLRDTAQRDARHIVGKKLFDADRDG